MRRQKIPAKANTISWDACVKGIDAAVIRNLPITSIALQRGLKRLSLYLQQIAMTRLTNTVALPQEQKQKRLARE
jgi:hypothetical protein